MTATNMCSNFGGFRCSTLLRLARSILGIGLENVGLWLGVFGLGMGVLLE